MKKIYTSIDIGTANIKVVVGEMFNNKLNILAASSIESEGLKKGLIVDGEAIVESLRTAKKDIEAKLGVEINNAIVSVPPNGARFSLVSGYSTIANERKVVTGNDIVRAIQASVYNKIDGNMELLTVYPLEFEIGDKKGIKKPLGLEGDKLLFKGVMIQTPRKNIYSIISAMEALEINVIDITFNAFGDYYEFKTPETDKKVGTIINIGAETTEISIFNKGVLMNIETLQLGGSNIDSDISYIYKIHLNEAKKLKEQFALANKKNASSNETIEIVNKNDELLTINQFELSEIVEYRLKEILDLAKKQIKLLTKKPISYIIVTGGVSESYGFRDLVEKELSNETTTPKIKTIGIRNNEYSSASGMIRYFDEKMRLRGKNYSMLEEEKQIELTSPRKRNLKISENVLNKVFGYFFNK